MENELIDTDRATDDNASGATAAEAVEQTCCKTTDTDKAEVVNLKHELEFNIGRSRRYMNYRAGHFGFLAKLVNVFGLVVGSAAFATAIANSQTILQVLSAFLVAISVLSLVFRWQDKAILFTNLYKRYTELERELVKCISLDDIKSIKAQYIAIELDEPAVWNGLNDICYNEQVMASSLDPEYREQHLLPLNARAKWTGILHGVWW